MRDRRTDARPAARRVPRPVLVTATLWSGLALLLGACGSDGAQSTDLTIAGSPDDAVAAFCGDLGGAIELVDRYGRIFQEPEITVGELRSDLDELTTVHDQLARSARELDAAVRQANASDEPSATTTTVLASLSADEHLAAIEDAEREVQDTIEGIDGDTSVVDAVEEVHLAAFGLEQAYLSLFLDAGCLEDDAAAVRQVRDYTAALQTDLQVAGYHSGEIDGVYGPATVSAVEALQQDAGLEVTGVVDPQTEAALARRLADAGVQQALNVAALQGVLTAEGHYHGPIDGVWSSEVEGALLAYQEAQALPPTGIVDPETLAALIGGGRDPGTTTTTSSSSSSSTSSTSSTTSTTSSS